MKAVILAGGVGSRLSEETHLKPKPMIEIGGKPILWHIMKGYSTYGVNEFVICLGYKGYLIKEYFANYFLHMCDVTFDIGRNEMDVHQSTAEPWRVTLVDTGEETMTGGRLRRVLGYVDDGDFCFTYGDGVADLDINALVGFHRQRGTIATVTAVQPPGRFGAMEVKGDPSAQPAMLAVALAAAVGLAVVTGCLLGSYLRGASVAQLILATRRPTRRIGAEPA